MIEIAWFVALAGLPAVVVVGSWSRRLGDRALHRLAIACAVGLVATSSLVWVVPGLRDFRIEGVMGGGLDGSLLRVDAFAAALLPAASILWLLALALAPRRTLDRGVLRRTSLATVVTLATFSTESPAALVLLSGGSVAIFLAALGESHRGARRIAAVHLWTAMAMFAVGVACLSWPRAGSTVTSVGIWLLVASALIRKGIFPFHAWVPEVFDRGRLGPAILFSAPQIGAYVTAVLVLPRAGADVLRLVAVLALLTAVYGAALAVVQSDARRACGYLFVSQSALVMAGLDCTSEVALTGGLVVWLSSAVAFAGLARCVVVLEARRGRLGLGEHHGGYDRMPALAVAFLLTGLACTGFPGTLGFVGEELLVDGAVEAFPTLGHAVVVAGALTGLAVLRMYLALFCGRRDRGTHLQLGRREAWTFAALAIAIVAAGLLPGPIVRSRVAAARDLLERRDALHVSARG